MAKEYGITISEGNVDVKLATDYQKVLDSRWLFLETGFETIFTVPGDLATYKILDHNLGYLPAFTYKFINTTNTDANFSNVTIYADTQSIYASSLGNETGFVRVFACDITTEYNSPSVQQFTDATTKRSKYGVKVTRNNSANIKSHNPSDFTLNTNTKAMSIHMHGKRTAQGSVLTIYTDIPYPPSFFVAQITNGKIYPMNSPQLASYTTGILTIAGAQAPLTGDYGVLLLKDPAQVAR